MPVLAGEEAGNERERFNRKRGESLFDSSLCDYGVGLFCFFGGDENLGLWDFFSFSHFLIVIVDVFGDGNLGRVCFARGG